MRLAQAHSAELLAKFLKLLEADVRSNLEEIKEPGCKIVPEESRQVILE